MIDILLATYNSERFINEQIDSIINQTYSNWHLIIRDDGSKDRTLEIIGEYMKAYPEKIELIQDEEKAGSPQANFAILLRYSKNEYAMLCDHDDVWLENKLEIMLNRMEKEQDKDSTPILIFSDYYMVDQELNIIGKSTDSSTQVYKAYTTLNRYLVQNYVTGCTTFFNHKLIEVMGDIPKNIPMHDWWIALSAAAMGRIIYLNEFTIYYRQHGDNCVGATNVKSLSYIISKIQDSNTKDSFNEYYGQAEKFLLMYKKQIPDKQLQIIEKFLELQNMNRVKKVITAIKYGFLKSNFVRIIGQFIYM